MPVKRDSDGNIIEEPTRVTDNFSSAKGAPAAPATPPQTGKGGAYDAKTVLAGRAASGERKPAGKEKDARTRIYRPGRAPSDTPVATASDAAMDDPPVGWLVVVAGPGQGNVLTLGNGGNSIGRDATERQTLDFGDEMISRSGHAALTYDPRGKKFYIQHGGGTNLTYVDEQPVLAPRELQSGKHIQIGNTTLRFIALCGEAFDWDAGGEG